MTEPVVVVIRTNSGDDVLAILNGKMDNTLKVQHPYYVKTNPASGTIAMIPYCVLSNEIHYEMKTDAVEFVVTAAPEITSKFLRMIDTAEKVIQSQEEQTYDDFAEALSYKNIMDGNDTKH